MKQVRGEYGVNNQNSVHCVTAYRSLSDEFEQFEIQHIPREENWEADALVEQAFDN